MTVIPGDQRPLADVSELERSHGRVDIAQDGHTVAAVVSAEYLESLEETIAVATDPELVAAIAEGEAELDAGQGIPAHEVEIEFLNRPYHPLHRQLRASCSTRLAEAAREDRHRIDVDG
ncbi:MAG TPA: type II toxin-antitoxin system prevent-host-death family antitoxin [Pseudonocardiaceae bacterium]|nr:type II toxin-antitoxin system prevent-host-death family antitoxin [Pseudonocardiaceae bacterium]